jgi:hypothetical protein
MTRWSAFYVEIWPPPRSIFYGVTFLRDTVELMVWFGFLQGKNDPPCRWILTGGSHFYVEKWPRGQYSMGVTSLRYTGNQVPQLNSNLQHKDHQIFVPQQEQLSISCRESEENDIYDGYSKNTWTFAITFLFNVISLKKMVDMF